MTKNKDAYVAVKSIRKKNPKEVSVFRVTAVNFFPFLTKYFLEFFSTASKFV